MTTIDHLFNEMGRVKARYDRQEVLNFLFEFTSQFAEYCKLPKSNLTYEAVISWKLAKMVTVLNKRYWSNKTLLYMEVTMPPYRCIPETLSYERQNWIDYWKKQEKLHPELLK